MKNCNEYKSMVSSTSASHIAMNAKLFISSRSIVYKVDGQSLRYRLNVLCTHTHNGV